MVQKLYLVDCYGKNILPAQKLRCWCLSNLLNLRSVVWRMSKLFKILLKPNWTISTKDQIWLLYLNKNRKKDGVFLFLQFINLIVVFGFRAKKNHKCGNIVFLCAGQFWLKTLFIVIFIWLLLLFIAFNLFIWLLAMTTKSSHCHRDCYLP